MSDNGTGYELLPGRRLIYFEDSRLWNGPGHILHSRRGAFADRYRRFPYGDIQAIAIRKTHAGKIYNLALTLITVILFFAAAVPAIVAFGGGGGLVFLWIGGGVALAFALTAVLLRAHVARVYKWLLEVAVWVLALAVMGPALVQLIDAGPLVALGFIAPVVFALMLSINVFRGPTCRFTIYTAIQEEPVPGLNRLRQAQQTAALLREPIEQAQGALSSDRLGEAATEATDVSSQAQSIPAHAGPAAPPSLHEETGAVHRALFIVMLAGAPFFLADLFVYAPLFARFMDVLNFLWVVSLGVLVMVAYARQRGSDLSDNIKTLTGAALTFLVVLVVFLWVVIVVGSPADSANLIQLLRHEKASGSTIILLDLVSLIGALSIGLTGVVFMSNERHLKQAGLASASRPPLSESDAPAVEDEGVINPPDEGDRVDERHEREDTSAIPDESLDHDLVRGEEPGPGPAMDDRENGE